MTEAGDFRQTQFQRTELAWRRTLVGVLAVAGLGSIHLLTGHHVALGLYVGSLSVLSIVPITARIRRLRAGHAEPLSWQPLSLVFGILALAVGVSVFG